MGKPVCPECGKEALNVSKGVDFRPAGAKFDSYVHSYEDGSSCIVDESCMHIIAYGKDHPKGGE